MRNLSKFNNICFKIFIIIQVYINYTLSQVTQLRLQQQNRARGLVALVPKSGARSEIDDSESSVDELLNYIPRTYSDSSSPPPSLPSSLENLNIFSDDDNEITEVISASALQLAPLSDSLDNTGTSSPSILSPQQLPVLDFLRNEITPLQISSLTSSIVTPSSPLASTSRYVPSPSSYNTPSPSATTRSKRPSIVIKKTKIVKPKRLAVTWQCGKFTGIAQVENIMTVSNEEKKPIDYFKLFFTDDIISMIVYHTNLYSTQKKGTSINVSEDDIRDFIAINILMGIVKIP